MITAEERKQINLKGYADIGGAKKNRYFTPDGREVYAVPQMRTYNILREGKIVSSGVRDANLDNGWLNERPEELKLYCPHCDKWHDTKEEVKECGVVKKAFQAKWDKKAKKEVKKDDRVEKLESDMSELKEMLGQLIQAIKEK